MRVTASRRIIGALSRQGRHQWHTRHRANRRRRRVVRISSHRQSEVKARARARHQRYQISQGYGATVPTVAGLSPATKDPRHSAAVGAATWRRHVYERRRSAADLETREETFNRNVVRRACAERGQATAYISAMSSAQRSTMTLRFGSTYLLFAVIGRFVEGMGAVECGCSVDCWCQRPVLSLLSLGVPPQTPRQPGMQITRKLALVEP
jgi:hypothetical protein